MRVSDIDPKLYNFWAARNMDELNGYKYCRVAGKVEALLSEFDDELPYETYEVFYDWGFDGYKDGFDVVCFYEKGPGYLHQNWRECRTYNKDYLSELVPAAMEDYAGYLEGNTEANRLKRMAVNNASELQKIKTKNDRWD